MSRAFQSPSTSFINRRYGNTNSAKYLEAVLREKARRNEENQVILPKNVRIVNTAGRELVFLTESYCIPARGGNLRVTDHRGGFVGMKSLRKNKWCQYFTEHNFFTAVSLINPPQPIENLRLMEPDPQLLENEVYQEYCMAQGSR